ncbi:MAG TPA: rhodanese-like domain-containing protein [Geopsychrobacteraceae bacterium]|jgi:hydroxyacylglutathione hydrolase
MQIDELARNIKTGRPPTVLDVRSGSEYRSGHIPGAVHAPLLKILLRRVTLPGDKEQLLVLTCEHGPRALLVKSLLNKAGYARVEMLDGHMTGWRQARLPLEVLS